MLVRTFLYHILYSLHSIRILHFFLGTNFVLILVICSTISPMLIHIVF